MPRWVDREGGQVVVWEEKKWCAKLPKWWRDNCGCKRECNLSDGLGDALFNMHPFYLKWLLRCGHVTIDGWVVKRIEKYRVRIFPWPKHLYRPWWEVQE